MATKEDILLLLSLDEEPPVSPGEWHRTWTEELDRRAREVLNGSVETVPWEDLRASIRADLQRRRQK